MSSSELEFPSRLENIATNIESPAVEEVASPILSPLKNSLDEFVNKEFKGKEILDKEMVKTSSKTIDSLRNKIVSKVNYKIKHRKNFSKLGARDIFQWKNPVASAAIYIIGQMLFYMLWRWNLTLALVLGRILLLQIIICFAYFIGMKIVAPNREVSIPNQFQVTPENVREYLTQLSDKVYGFLAWYISVLLCKDFRVTIAFALAVEVFNRVIAKRLTTMTLSYLVFNFSFILPILYEIFEEEIHNSITFVQDKLTKVLETVQQKINQLLSKTEVLAAESNSEQKQESKKEK